MVNVRIGRDGAKARQHQFEIITSQQRSHEFRVSAPFSTLTVLADTHEDMMGWVAAIQASILWSYEHIPEDASAVSNAPSGVEVTSCLSFQRSVLLASVFPKPHVVFRLTSCRPLRNCARRLVRSTAQTAARRLPIGCPPTLASCCALRLPFCLAT